ncbi:hypothetical protein CBS63078_309 [Aspergillus niger]|nr:hypothetical protein CBS63078_309 [Aspergillus niger]
MANPEDPHTSEPRALLDSLFSSLHPLSNPSGSWRYYCQLGTKNLLTVTSPKEHAKRTKTIGPGFSSTTIYFAFDVITDLIFGKAGNLLGSQHFRCTAFLGRLGEKLFKDVRGMKRYHRLVNGMMADAASMSGHVFSWLTKAHDSATGPGLTDADVYFESVMLAVGSYFTPVSLCANLYLAI